MSLQSELVSQGNFLFKHRSNLPLLLLMLGIAVMGYSIYNGFFLDYLQPRYEILSLIIGLLGLFIRIVTVGYTPVNTSGRNTKVQLADELNTTGMYSLVRHPLYLGNYLMWLSIAILTQHIWFILLFITCYWLYYERIMIAEESFLISKFGEIYADWANKVPSFIPRKFRWTKPKYPFSFKKVLKKEKNGLFALFLIFYLFKGVETFLLDGEVVLGGWQYYGMIITGIIYLILKVLKYRGFFDEKGR